MELSKEYIDFLGMKISDDKIKFQEHIVKKIMDFEHIKGENNKLIDFLSHEVYSVEWINNTGK